MKLGVNLDDKGQRTRWCERVEVMNGCPAMNGAGFPGGLDQNIFGMKLGNEPVKPMGD